MKEKKKMNKKKEEKYLENFGICTITKDFIIHPYLIPNSNYYVKMAIIRWINNHPNAHIIEEELSYNILIKDFEYKIKIRYSEKNSKNKYSIFFYKIINIR